MDAVDLWYVVAAVLFGIAVLLSLPGVVVNKLNAILFVSGGLLAYMVGLLVARN